MHYEGVATETVPFEGPPDPLEPVLSRYLLTGDEQAMEEIVRETRPRLLAAARRIGDPQDAEDAVQGAYLSLVRHRGAELGAPVFPWLLTAAVRIAYRRKAVDRREDAIARRLSHPASPGTPLALAVGSEEAALLRREVAALPALYRDPVVLHYLQGLPTSEVARLLDAPEATVRVRLHRARLLLRTLWSPRLAYGMFLFPWFFSDSVRALGSLLAPLSAAGGAMKAGTAVVLAVVAAGAGALAGARLLAPTPPPPDLEAVRSEATGKVQAEVEGLKSERATALESVQRERARAEKAEKESAALREAVAAAEKKAAEAAAASARPAFPPLPPGVYRFLPGEFEGVLREIDWGVVGTNMNSMLPLIQRLAEALAKGERPSPDAMQEIQKHNMPLVKVAVALDGRLPGSGINGTFTHPAFMANAIASTLEAAGKPLSEEQARALDKVGQEFLAADARRLKGYDERSLELQKVVDEVAIKDGSFEAAFAILSADQRDTLSPPVTRGRIQTDLFSSALMWVEHIQYPPMTFRDREDLVQKVTTSIVDQYSIPDAKQGEAKSLAAELVDSLPREIVEKQPDPLEKQGLVKGSDLLAVARRQVALLGKLATMGLDEAAAAKVRKSHGAYMLMHVVP